MYNVIIIYLVFKYFPTSSIYLLSTFVSTYSIKQLQLKWYTYVHYASAVKNLHANLLLASKCVHII